MTAPVNDAVWSEADGRSSYVTIDWIHDAVSCATCHSTSLGSQLTWQIKESSRVRKMRINGKRSYRGAIANAWDRFQGWMLVTVIGKSRHSHFEPHRLQYS